MVFNTGLPWFVIHLNKVLLTSGSVGDWLERLITRGPFFSALRCTAKSYAQPGEWGGVEASCAVRKLNNFVSAAL